MECGSAVFAGNAVGTAGAGVETIGVALAVGRSYVPYYRWYIRVSYKPVHHAWRIAFRPYEKEGSGRVHALSGARHCSRFGYPLHTGINGNEQWFTKTVRTVLTAVKCFRHLSPRQFLLSYSCC